MTSSAVRVGRIGGADVLIRPSIIVMGVLVVLLFASRFTEFSDRPYVLGAVLVVGLYASVFVHELAHLLIARILKYRVDAVTLHFFGGETAVIGDPKRPAHEFSIAVAGPIASLVLAAVAGWAAGAVAADDATVLLSLIAWLNLLLAVVNLLPGLPLDGGRAVRGIAWAVAGPRDRATRITAWIGRGTAVVLVVLILLALVGGRVGPVDVAIVTLVAGFLWLGAGGALTTARRQRRLASVVAAELLITEDPGVAPPDEVPALPVSLAGADLLRALAAHPAAAYRLVDADGRLCGYLRTADVDAAYRQELR